MRLRIQAAEMSFPRRVAVLSLRHRLGRSDIREELGAEQLLLCFERNQFRWFRHAYLVGDAKAGPGHVEEIKSLTAWEHLGVQSENGWIFLRLLPPRPDPDKWQNTHKLTYDSPSQ